MYLLCGRLWFKFCGSKKKKENNRINRITDYFITNRINHVFLFCDFVVKIGIEDE